MTDCRLHSAFPGTIHCPPSERCPSCAAGRPVPAVLPRISPSLRDDFPAAPSGPRRPDACTGPASAGKRAVALGSNARCRDVTPRISRSGCVVASRSVFSVTPCMRAQSSVPFGYKRAAYHHFGRGAPCSKCARARSAQRLRSGGGPSTVSDVWLARELRAEARTSQSHSHGFTTDRARSRRLRGQNCSWYSRAAHQDIARGRSGFLSRVCIARSRIGQSNAARR